MASCERSTASTAAVVLQPSPSKWKKRFQNIRKLGYGTFGVCWVSRHLDTNEEKVVKQVFVGNKSHAQKLQIMDEAVLLMSLKHPGILGCEEAYDNGQFIVMITELCEGGDLSQLVSQVAENKQSIESHQIVDWITQLAHALDYLHSHGILHRDVKSSNVFLTWGIVKLGDFGVARILGDDTVQVETIAGTPHYMAPEVLLGVGYTSKCDLWSLGCIIYELCMLEKPFGKGGLAAIIKSICDSEPPTLPAEFSVPSEIMSKLLVRDPDKRFSAMDVLTFHLVTPSIDLMKQNTITGVSMASSSLNSTSIRIEQLRREKAERKASLDTEEQVEVCESDSDSSSNYDTASDDEDLSQTSINKPIPDEAIGTTECQTKRVASQDGHTFASIQADSILQEVKHDVKHGRTYDFATNEDANQWELFNAQSHDKVINNMHESEPSPDRSNNKARFSLEQLLLPTQTIHHATESETWFVPHVVSPSFSGRQEELRAIYSALFINFKTEKQACLGRFGISQSGGAGKTQLMLKYAWSNRFAYRGGVYMLEAESVLRLRQSCIQLVEILTGEKQLTLEKKSGHKHIAESLFSHLPKGKRWLICIDAADSDEVLDLLSSIYFPVDRDIEHGHLVYTSRSPNKSDWAKLGIPSPLELSTLTPGPAAELLFRYAKGAFEATSSEVEESIEGLGRKERESLYLLAATDKIGGLDGLPLALELAGSYILRTNISFGQYRELYEHQRDLCEIDEHFKDICNVAATWAINIKGLSSSAYLLLMALTCIPSSCVSENILFKISNACIQEQVAPGEMDAADAADRSSQLVDELVHQFSILQTSRKRSNTGHNFQMLREYSVPRLVRWFVRNKSASELKIGERLSLEALYQESKNQTYGMITGANRSERSAIENTSAQGKALLQSMSPDECIDHRAVFLRTDGFIAQFLCLYDDAIQSYEESLKLFRRSLQPGQSESVEIALVINQLGNALASKGQYLLALDKCNEAYEILSRLIRDDDPDNAEIAGVIHRMATIHHELGNMETALQFYQQSLEMKNRIYGDDVDHIEIASTLYRIGNVLEAQSDYRGALEHYINSLNMKKNLYQDDEPRADLAYALFSIGSVLHRQRALDKALKKFQEALAMRKMIYGEDAVHTSIAMTLQRIGQVLFDKGDFEGAKKQFEKALKIRKTIFQSDHVDIHASKKSIEECDQALTVGGW